MRSTEWNEKKDRVLNSLDRDYLRSVFDRFTASEDEHLISKENLRNALDECGKTLSEQGVVDLFQSACSNVHANGLTFDEFEVAVLKPSPVEEDRKSVV